MPDVPLGKSSYAVLATWFGTVASAAYQWVSTGHPNSYLTGIAAAVVAAWHAFRSWQANELVKQASKADASPVPAGNEGMGALPTPGPNQTSSM